MGRVVDQRRREMDREDDGSKPSDSRVVGMHEERLMLFNPDGPYILP